MDFPTGIQPTSSNSVKPQYIYWGSPSRAKSQWNIYWGRLGSLALTTPGVNQHWVILVHAPMKCLIQVTGLSSPRNRCGSWTFLGKPGKTRLFITIVPTKVAVCHLGGTNYVQTQGQLAVSSPIQKGPSQDYHQLSMNQTIQNEDENMNIHLHPIQNQDFSVLCKSQMEWTSALWKRGYHTLW